MNKICFSISLFLFPIVNILFAQDDLALANKYLERSEELSQNYDSCIYYTRLAQTYFKKAEAWESYVNCYNGLSTVYYWKEDYEQYKLNASKALQAASKYLDKRSKSYAYAINNMGILYNRKGDYKKAIELYKNSLEIQKKGGQAQKYIARTYKNIGKVYQHKGDYLESIKYFNKSIAIRNASKNNQTSSFANDLMELARGYENLNQSDSALYFYHKSLEVLEQIPSETQYLSTPVRIGCHQDIAQILLEDQQLNRSFEYIQKALSYQKEDVSYRKETSYILIAKYYLAKGQKQKALESMYEALDIIKQNAASNPMQTLFISIYQILGDTYYDIEKYEDALANYQLALQKATFNFIEKNTTKNPPLSKISFKLKAFDILTGKAKTLTQLYQNHPENLDYLRQAFDCYQLIKQLIRQLRQDFLATGSKHILAAKASPIYEAAIENALLLYRQTNEEAYLADAFNSAENNKAILLLESLTEDLAKKSAGIPDSLLVQEYNLTIDLAFYEKTLKLEKQKGEEANGEKIKNWEALLFDLQEKHQNLIGYLERDFPRYYELKYTDATIAAQEIQQALSPGQMLLEYFVGKEQSYLFVITPARIAVEPIELTPVALQAIDQIRNLISQPPDYETAEADFQAYLTNAHALYRQLLAPALSEVKSLKHLVIIPDDLLSFLPFEILLSQPDQAEEIDYRAVERSYLLKQAAISYDYSASLWHTNLLANRQQPASQPFAGFAPTFNEGLASRDRVCTDDQLYSLKCSQQEVEAIQQTLGGDLFLGMQASKDAFQTSSASYQILHLATHACVDEQNPMLNKIHFTDDYLSNYDLSTLSLNAELTVLSACNTGTGKLLEGEGVMSLARNFTQAGCRSTVMSLWSVNDCSTSKIMTQFYAHLAAGQNKNEALKNAKLDYLTTASKMERSPYYWAAFVQLGNSEAMTFQSGFSFQTLLLLGGGLFIISLLLFLFRKKA